MSTKTVKTRYLSGNPNSDFDEVTRLVVYELIDDGESGYYSYLDGIGRDGLFYETDDLGPYKTVAEAESAAMELFEACADEHARYDFFSVEEKSAMILLNFSHPLTLAQLMQIEALAGKKIERVVEIHTQIDTQQALVPQVVALLDRTHLSAQEFRSVSLLVNPPSLNFIAVALLAELHGRCGYFPAMLRMRPVQGSTPTRYEVAELIDLQFLRDEAHNHRVA